jgi:uncharacterized protein (DUF1330 family)
MAAADVIVDMKITDMDRYKDCIATAPVTVTAAGSEYEVRSGCQDALEGARQPGRLAMLRLPSSEQAMAWYDGKAYHQARARRAGTTELFNMILVEGIAGPV